MQLQLACYQAVILSVFPCIQAFEFNQAMVKFLLVPQVVQATVPDRGTQVGFRRAGLVKS